MSHHTVEWIDHHREPQNPPDPDYPKGKDVIDPNLLVRGGQSCVVELPYPAKRCGVYMVACDRCGLSVGVTTAGRPDDPRSIRMACKGLRH